MKEITTFGEFMIFGEKKIVSVESSRSLNFSVGHCERDALENRVGVISKVFTKSLERHESICARFGRKKMPKHES